MSDLNSRTRLGALATLLAGMMTAQVVAHHGTSVSYDDSKNVTITGKVTEFWWRNPHSALFLDVTDDKGAHVSWRRDGQPRHAAARWLDSPCLRRGRCGVDRGASIARGHARWCLRGPLHGNGEWQNVDQGTGAMTGNRAIRRSAISMTAAAAVAALLSVPSAFAQTPTLSGVWLGGNQRGGKFTQWLQTQPPFTPDGLARFNANKPGKGPRMAPPAFGNDPLSDANPPGLLRTLVYFRPIEIIQLPDRIVQLFEYGHFWRTIWMDGRAMPTDPGPFWYGYSVGKWEGDTLIVQDAGLDSREWLDEWGTPFSDDAKVTERWRKVDAKTLQLTITVDDPHTYTKSWTSDARTLLLQPKGSANGEIIETIMAPIDEKAFNERVRNPAGGIVKKESEQK